MNYKIKEKELCYLLKRDEELTALEFGGVDNWSWYGESLEKYDREKTPDLSKYSILEEDNFKREYHNGQDLFYNNNPCKFVAYLSKDIAVIIVLSSPDYDSITGSQWCTPCNVGGKSTHTCEQYNDVIDALKDNDNPTRIPLIVDVKFLRPDSMIVFKHTRELQIIESKVKEQKGKAIALSKMITEQEAKIEENKKVLEEINKINNI